MAELKRVLMIAQVFPPANRAGTARPFYFAKHLSEFGYCPTVIAALPEEEDSFDNSLLPQLEGRAEVVHIRKASLRRMAGGLLRSRERGRESSPQGTRSKGTGKKRVSVLGRAASFAQRHWYSGLWTLPVLAQSVRILRKSSFDLIWATGDPWNSLMAGWWLSKLTGKPLVADFRDPWTYGVLWSPRGEREASWNERWERRVVTRATRTVFTSPLTTSIMARKYGVGIGDRFVTITNGFDDAAPSAARHESNGKCVFRFVGSLNGNREPNVLFKAIAQARTDPDFSRDVRFQFIGRMNKYETQIERLGLNDMVQSVGMVDYDASRRYIQTADVLVLLQTMGSIGADCISGKAFEYLAAQRPILAVVPEEGGDAWLIRSTCSGTVTGISDTNRIVEVLVRYWREWQDKGHVDAPQSQGIQQYGRRNVTRKLAALFDEILGDGRDRRIVPSDGRCRVTVDAE